MSLECSQCRQNVLRLHRRWYLGSLSKKKPVLLCPVCYDEWREFQEVCSTCDKPGILVFQAVQHSKMWGGGKAWVYRQYLCPECLEKENRSQRWNGLSEVSEIDYIEDEILLREFRRKHGK